MYPTRSLPIEEKKEEMKKNTIRSIKLLPPQLRRKSHWPSPQPLA